MKEVNRKAFAERFLRAVFRRFGVLKKTEKNDKDTIKIGSIKFLIWVVAFRY